MMTLTADGVDQVFNECLFRTDDELKAAAPADPAFAEGILCKFCFCRDKLDGHRGEIERMLLELPDEFMQSKGGGMSFLNACVDKRGNHWTGLHQTMDRLFVLGLAIGKAEQVLPRDMWEMLPGGMPYYVVLDSESGAPEASLEPVTQTGSTER